MSHLLRLPGTACRHFSAGRCLLEEHQNPGWDPAHACRVVTRLCEAYDGFLGRAEAFGLEEASAFAIWSRRFAVLTRQETGCQDYEPGGTDDFPGCSHAKEHVCLLAMPACRGQCPDYAPHHQQRGQSRTP